MKPAHRSLLVATLSFSLLSAGAIWVLVPSHEVTGGAGDLPQAGEELVTGSVEPAFDARPVERSERLSFVPAPQELRGSLSWEARPPELLAEPVLVAAHPNSWSVAVERKAPVATARPRRSKSRKSSTAKRRRKQSYSLKQRLAKLGPAAKIRLVEKFKKASVSWPPRQVAFVAIKDQKVVELHSRTEEEKWSFVYSYPVLAASGGPGPKLLRGDKQVPEGIYRISYLNPNSSYHVSLRVNYPNKFDRKMAARDGRTDLGGDIMIHGKNVSAGCLAMGDPAAEELFVLGSEVGMSNIKVIIAPTDLRKDAKPPTVKGPEWVPELHNEIAEAMSQFDAPPKPVMPNLLALIGL